MIVHICMFGKSAVFCVHACAINVVYTEVLVQFAVWALQVNHPYHNTHSLPADCFIRPGKIMFPVTFSTLTSFLL